MILTKGKSRGLALIILITGLFLVITTRGDILTFGSDLVARCPASDAVCSCGDSSGGVYRCDNSDYDDTLENSMTIDSCVDGPEVTPQPGFQLADYYEFVKEIAREDLNDTYQGNLTDGYLRAKDWMKVSVTFVCTYTDDSYSILYKNSTNQNNNDWQLLRSGLCFASSESELVTVEAVKQLDDVAGNHTIRAIVSYSSEHPEATCSADFDDPDYHDTDDLVIEVLERLDLEAPEITVIAPAENEQIELVDGLVIPVMINVTDRTGVDFVNITLVHNNTSTPLNAAQEGSLYLANITNITSLGLYTIKAWANDTIRTNGTTNTRNHVNNYTNISFYLKNDAGVNISNPDFNNIYPTLSVLLDFRINDRFAPYDEVYVLLDNKRTNLTESEFVQTANSTSYALNNSNDNLSQSFMLNKNTTILYLGLLIKRKGSSSSNSSVFLIEDSGGPFGNIIATSQFQNTSNASFGWTKAVLNTTVNITEGRKYWVTLAKENSSEYIMWPYNNSYPDGEYYGNSSLDLSLKIFDLYEYNYTLNSTEGLNTLKVCEVNSISNTECSYTQYQVDLTPPYFESMSYTSQVELGSLQTITIDVKDTLSPISSVLLEFNNSNISMSRIQSIPNGGRYRTSLNLTGLKSYNFSIFANDSAGWQNETATYYFSVNDTSSPALLELNKSPSSEDSTDPNVTLYFNFTLSDYSTISEAYLQYRPNTTPIWTNLTPKNLTSIEYTANFTPLNETIYYYRVYAKDSVANTLTSQTQSVDVFYERYWTHSPLTYGLIMVNASQTLNLYNVTIINYGDLDLPFSIQKHPSVDYTMVFSNTTFNVPKGENATVQINITSPNVKNEYHSSQSIITCLVNCPKKTATVGNQIMIDGDGPFLSMGLVRLDGTGFEIKDPYILRYNDRTNTEPYKFKATIENTGDKPANNVSFQFTFQNSTMWIGNITNPQNLSVNFSLGTSQYQNSTRDVVIEFLIDKNTQLGIIYNLTASAEVDYNGTLRNDSKAARINVTNQQPPQEICGNKIDDDGDGQIDEGCSEGDDGGGESGTMQSAKLPERGGTGGGLGGGITLHYNLTVILEKYVDVLRGTNRTIMVSITNPYKNKYFADIALRISGYFQNQIIYTPKTISKLEFNETKSFNITFNAPPYLSHSRKDVQFTFEYIIVPVTLNKSHGEKGSQTKSFTLIINEVDRKESFACLQRSAEIIRNASSRKYATSGLEAKFEQQSSAIANMDFTLAERLCDEIRDDFERIMLHEKKLAVLYHEINEKERDGYSMMDVLRLYNITEQLFADGEYSSLENAIKDLENAYLLQVKLEDSDLAKRFRKFVKNNIKEIIIQLLAIATISWFVWRKISEQIIINKISNLEKERALISGKILNLQKEYFADKRFSSGYFRSHLEKYRKRMAEISDSVVKYQTMQLRINKKAGKTDAMEENEKKLSEMISGLQKHYYVDKTIDKDSFEKANSQYKKTLADIKKQIKILKTKKKSRTEIFIGRLRQKTSIYAHIRNMDAKVKDKGKGEPASMNKEEAAKEKSATPRPPSQTLSQSDYKA